MYTGRSPGSTRTKSKGRKAGRCKILAQEIPLSGISLPMLKSLLQEDSFELLIKGFTFDTTVCYQGEFIVAFIGNRFKIEQGLITEMNVCFMVDHSSRFLEACLANIVVSF